MMITSSPITQSWATWLEAMMRQRAPMMVSCPSWVARCTVTYSRIDVSSPMATPTGSPAVNFRSWGSPPTMAPWPMRQRAPRVTRPSSTTWAPISAPGPMRASGPMTLYGPIRTPASSSARGSTMAEGWMPGASVTRVSLELAHALLQRAHPAHQLRKHGFGCPDPSGERGRPAGSAAHHLPRLHVAGHARLRGEDGPLADGHVIGDADLAGQDGAIADGAGARDADLGHQDHVLTDLAVVAHLYEVVDLAPAADDGVAQRGAVDGGVGADLHVVGDAEAAHLGNLAMRGAVEGVAEAIRAQHGAGVHDHAMADDHARSEEH